MSVAAFDDHQRRAIALLGQVLAEVREGRTAREIADAARDLAPAHGFDRWFHKPRVVIEPASRADLRPVARPGALVRVDVGPGSAEAFGDVGATVAVGGSEPEVVDAARRLVRATCGYASRHKTFGELFVFARAWANNRQGRLVGAAVGHACLPPRGWIATGYPRSAKAAAFLRRHQGRMLNPRRLEGVYAIQPVLEVGGRRASFEELIVVGAEGRRVLGRASLDEIGDFGR